MPPTATAPGSRRPCEKRLAAFDRAREGDGARASGGPLARALRRCGEPALLRRRRRRPALRADPEWNTRAHRAGVRRDERRTHAAVPGGLGRRRRAGGRRVDRYGFLRPSGSRARRQRRVVGRDLAIRGTAAPARPQRRARRRSRPRPRHGDDAFRRVARRTRAGGGHGRRRCAPVPHADRHRRVRASRGGRVARSARASRRGRRSPARAGRALRDHDAEPSDRRSGPRHAARDQGVPRDAGRRRQEHRLRRLRRGRVARPRPRRRRGRTAAVIYRKGEHEPLAGRAWDERLARYAIADVVDDVIAAGPSEEKGVYANGIYEGAAGEVYALRVLGREVDWPLGPGDGPGYADGELGIALVAGDVERFRAAAPDAIANEWIELLYGAGGALVGARLLGLDDIAREAIRRLWSTWSFDSKLRACIWTQHVPGGKVGQSIGFAHGFAGNVFALLKAAPLQSRDHQTELMHRLIEALHRTALSERKVLNWPPEVGDKPSKLRVQWCHGA